MMKPTVCALLMGAPALLTTPLGAQRASLDLGASVSTPVGAYGAQLSSERLGSAAVGGSLLARLSVRVADERSRWITTATAGFNPMRNPATAALIGQVDFGHYLRVAGHTGLGYETELLEGLAGYAHITAGGTLFRGPTWRYTTGGYWAPPVSGVMEYGYSATASGTLEGGFVFRNGLGIGLLLQYVPNVVFVGEGSQEGRRVQHAFETPASTLELGVFYRFR